MPAVPDKKVEFIVVKFENVTVRKLLELGDPPVFKELLVPLEITT